MVENQMTEKSKAIYPGSFDPVTRGHLDVIERARGLFGTLHIAVLSNPEKKALFTPEERIELLRSETAGLAGAGVLEFSSFEGLTARLAVEVEAGNADALTCQSQSGRAADAATSASD